MGKFANIMDETAGVGVVEGSDDDLRKKHPEICRQSWIEHLIEDFVAARRTEEAVGLRMSVNERGKAIE